MGINHYFEMLSVLPPFQRLVGSLRQNSSLVYTQVIDEAVPFLIPTLMQETQRPILLICPTPDQSRRVHEQIKTWNNDENLVLRFSETESLPYERLVTDSATTQQRISTLSKLNNLGVGELPLIVSSVAALCQGTLSKEILEKSTDIVSKGDKISLSDLALQVSNKGYSIEPTTSTNGEASRRGGGIMDIFPTGSESPFRIELWGDEVDSIRVFDPNTQRSKGEVPAIRIDPAIESLPIMISKEELDRSLSRIDLSNCSIEDSKTIRDELDSILKGLIFDDIGIYSGIINQGLLTDYLPKNTIIIFYRPTDIATAAWDAESRLKELKTAKETRGEIPFNLPPNYCDWNSMENKFKEFFPNNMHIVPWGAEDLIATSMHIMPFSSTPTYQGDLEKLTDDVKNFTSSDGKIIVNTMYPDRIADLIKTKNIRNKDSILVLEPGANDTGDGFILNSSENNLMVLGDKEIFGLERKRRTIRKTSVKREAFFEEISPGDYVVHVEHGIARFLGTDKRKDDETNQEYLILQYSQGDKLYVPFDHIDRVAPYVAPMDRAPSLTRLGTQEWVRTKARVEKSTKEMAAELLSIYAQRELAEGYQMGPDTKWQNELEHSFPYVETSDQLSALSEIKSDMESKKPMDRLICGDVGYGKTEVALRAAFKAVMEGKQVGILVPTTVLAQQHFETFSERLQSFPVTIQALSRFKSSSDQKAILKSLNDGSIDICIGTHRLIQRDVKFKDVGLVIIDEEQRFGVSHKEQLKSLRSQVDVLTLTATPIPRTLHMSLAGVRDMSTIETAPDARMPIKTYVSEFSDDLIREAILREIDREGQVYFLHNRIQNIDYMAEYLTMLVPDARVGIAHGQMSEGELEKSMSAFSEGTIDVLVCTTIIESGLDIPNANTLIVNRADRFGLAQLYQLRGRIGRSSTRAYSYLLIPRARSLTETSERRLKAMLQATELGSGFKIAMKDLEIRGAGNILGAEQSGHIFSVGFDLYTRLLSNAVEDLRSQMDTSTENTDFLINDKELIEASINLRIPVGIPPEYISDLPSRLDVYREINTTKTLEDVKEKGEELKDRFGPLPWQTINLLLCKRLKIMAPTAGIESITKSGDKLTLQFSHPVSDVKIPLSKLLGSKWKIGNEQIRTSTENFSGKWEEDLTKSIHKISEFYKKFNSQLSVTIDNQSVSNTDTIIDFQERHESQANS